MRSRIHTQTCTVCFRADNQLLTNFVIAADNSLLAHSHIVSVAIDVVSINCSNEYLYSLQNIENLQDIEIGVLLLCFEYVPILQQYHQSCNKLQRLLATLKQNFPHGPIPVQFRYMMRGLVLR